MNAYITLLSTVNYLPGVIVLHESLKQVGATYPLYVGVSVNVPYHVDEELGERGMLVIRLPAGIKIPDSVMESSGHWGNTFDKLHLFGLTDFSKLVYLDSDMLVMANIDELFNKPHMSAVAAGRLVHPDWRRLNSGIMVIEPENMLPEKIAATLQEVLQERSSVGIQAIGDQDLINAYYPKWPEATELHLDDGYNVFYSHLDAYVDSHGYSLPTDSSSDSSIVRIVHFIGPNKPWMKWARLRQLYNTYRKLRFTRHERKIFGSYIAFMKGVPSYR